MPANTTTLQAIKAISPKAKVDVAIIADTIDKYGSKYGVDTTARLQAFIAQAAHETAGFNTLEEYASGAAYEGRKDLGNTQPGDGKKFKGHGIFQITGRTNHLAASKHLFGDDRLLTDPRLLTEPKWATISALWYWKSRGLSELADKGDFETITKRINGGLNGWADRLSYYEKLKLYVFNNPVKTTTFAITGLLIIGLGIYYTVLAFKKKL